MRRARFHYNKFNLITKTTAKTTLISQTISHEITYRLGAYLTPKTKSGRRYTEDDFTHLQKENEREHKQMKNPKQEK